MTRLTHLVPSFSFTLLLTSAAFAQEIEAPRPASTAATAADAGTPTPEPTPPGEPVAEAEPAETTAEVAPPTPSDAAQGTAPFAQVEETQTTTSPSAPASVRSALARSAFEERAFRYGESALGLTAAGALLGVGFAAEGPDMTWSHVLWVSSGLVAAGSLAHLFIPTEVESLAHDAEQKTDAELHAAWKKVAARAKTERRAGAVFGTLLGAAAAVGGVVVFEDEGSDLSDDSRTILGATLLAGGALTMTKGVVDWFVPSAMERDYRAFEAASGPKLSFSAAPTLGGAAASVSGVF